MISQSRPVLVLGMHRSGTSYLASVLASCGVRMGESLLAADAGNPRGYFEDVSVLAFHKKLLARRAAPSQTRADFLPGGDFSGAWNAEESAEAEALVAKLERAGLWGWKEPRTCLFLDEWLKKLPGAKCVAVYRHPLEIYYSFLKRRDWSALFTPESVFEATAFYNRAILSAREKSPENFLILHAGASFADSPALARRLASFLGTDALAAKLPEFAAKEFSSLGVLKEQHDLMALAYPDAAASYDAMQAVAEKPGVFGSDDSHSPLPSAALSELVAAFRAKGGARQAAIDALCLNVPADELRHLRGKIAEEVDAEIGAVSAERDKYIANFEKYKGMYENYFEAWKGADRTLAETRDWVNRDLLPKIERWRKLLQEHGVTYQE
jgi:hypothetical protein